MADNIVLFLNWLPVLLLTGYGVYAMCRHLDPERVCTVLLAGCVAEVFGLCLYLDHSAFPECLIQAVKIVFQVLQGDSDDFLALSTTQQGPMALVQAMSVLTPVMTAGTVFVLLYRRLPWPVLPPVKCHIFSALDSHAILLAKSIDREEGHARFLFLRTRREDLSADTLRELGTLWYSCYPDGEIQLFRRHLSLRFRPLCLYFLTENSEENFDRMEEFLSYAKDRSLFRFVKRQGYRELFLLSETSSAPMLIDHLRQTYSCLRGTELRLLDRYRAASLHLMKTAPLYQARREGNARILLLGMGRVGRSLYRTMASMGSGKPEFHLCDQSMTPIHDILKQQYPELEEDLTVIPKVFDAEGTDLETLLDSSTFDYIVVALGNDERNLRVTAALYRHYRKKYWSGSVTGMPRICVNLEDETKARSTERIYPQRDLEPWDPRVTVFGTDRQVFSAEVLLPRGLWLAARKLHAGINGGAEPTPDWSEYERRSSIAAAAHADVHIASITPADQEVDLFPLHYPEIAQTHLAELTEAEHQRWMNYIRSEGMTLASRAIWQRYAPVLHKHVDVRGQLSPCLVKTAELDALYGELKPYLSGSTLSFRQRDELVVRNADRLVLLRETAESAIELR